MGVFLLMLFGSGTLGLACRHEPEVDNIVIAERALAKKQAKAARIRRAMFPSTASSSSESSSDSVERDIS